MEEPQPPPRQAPVMPPRRHLPTNDLDVFADKVGFVPNLRKVDNTYQAKFIGISIALGMTLAVILIQIPDCPWFVKAAVGIFAGLVIGVLVTGAILAVRNLKR